ncbi:MAG: carbohydrate kinase [Candidatus Marinimicrobia bacterium]|nr:carbohydrate kinase [Candidatus Neomarinimicrobiota bacterium]
MYSIGYDIGSSSIKGSLINLLNGEILKSAQYPEQEMVIESPQIGWAEQHPEVWWEAVKIVTAKILDGFNDDKKFIKFIGISYQMHGLVTIDKNGQVIRPAIIWCDSRAVESGEQLEKALGTEFCLENYLNAPGNFTLAKLKWVKDNEPENYAKIYKIMLPGDYIAMKLTGEIVTTASGLSEGIFWNFKTGQVAEELMEKAGISKDFVPTIVDTFSDQGTVLKEFTDEFGLATHVKVAYRAGDQPNNAFSLNVLKPGEVATTAGTSGVVYGVSDRVTYDPKSRVNTFAHVNHHTDDPHLGILLCVNGCGISNSWIKKIIGWHSYDEMNSLAAKIAIGSDNIQILPFGNGAERMFENRNIGAHILGLNFNRHHEAHLFRATHEAVAFSLSYGMEIMQTMGVDLQIMRAGSANMFLSPIFRQTLSNVNSSVIELYNTDGSVGAARGAALGGGYYATADEAFANLKVVDRIEPDANKGKEYFDAYQTWKTKLGENL